MSKLLSTSQVAEILGVTRETVAAYALNHVIPASRIARRWKFAESDVSDYIRRSRRGR
jgi:excisionase family DNA binding protein